MHECDVRRELLDPRPAPERWHSSAATSSLGIQLEQAIERPASAVRLPGGDCLAHGK
jgi:hypothetical protein